MPATDTLVIGAKDDFVEFRRYARAAQRTVHEQATVEAVERASADHDRGEIAHRQGSRVCRASTSSA